MNRTIDRHTDLRPGEFIGFFVIIAEDDTRLKRHPAEIDARLEAERLAVANPGRRFIVMESKQARRVDRPVACETPVFEIPF